MPPQRRQPWPEAGCFFWLSVRSILGKPIYEERLKGEFFKFGTNSPLDSRVNWIKLVAKDYCDTTKHAFVHSSNNCALIIYLTEIISKIKWWWSDDVLYPKGHLSTPLWNHNVLLRHFNGHNSMNRRGDCDHIFWPSMFGGGVQPRGDNSSYMCAVMCSHKRGSQQNQLLFHTDVSAHHWCIRWWRQWDRPFSSAGAGYMRPMRTWKTDVSQTFEKQQSVVISSILFTRQGCPLELPCANFSDDRVLAVRSMSASESRG